MMRQEGLPAAFTTRMGQLLADRYSASLPLREHHGRDESIFAASLPDAVAYPKDAAEVVAIVTLCNQFSIPVIPYGAGSSLEIGRAHV